MYLVSFRKQRIQNVSWYIFSSILSIPNVSRHRVWCWSARTARYPRFRWRCFREKDGCSSGKSPRRNRLHPLRRWRSTGSTVWFAPSWPPGPQPRSQSRSSRRPTWTSCSPPGPSDSCTRTGSAHRFRLKLLKD